MSDFDKHLQRQFENPEFAAEWACQRTEREHIRAIIAAQVEQNRPQNELAEKSGVPQPR